MTTPASAPVTYICPMHPDVHESAPGRCPKCGMALIAQGTRVALLHHMLGNPLHLAAMATIMIALMAAGMMLMR